MIKFREHRGTLEESLKTTKEFEKIVDIFHYIRELYVNELLYTSALPIKDFNIRHYGFDGRCNQILYAVSGPSPFGIFGFIFEEEIENDK